MVTDNAMRKFQKDIGKWSSTLQGKCNASDSEGKAHPLVTQLAKGLLSTGYRLTINWL